MKRTFEGLRCPRGVPAENHALNGYTDVLFAAGMIDGCATLACVTDEALAAISADEYLHPDQVPERTTT